MSHTFAPLSTLYFPYLRVLPVLPVALPRATRAEGTEGAAFPWAIAAQKARAIARNEVLTLAPQAKNQTRKRHRTFKSMPNGKVKVYLWPYAE